MGKYPYFITNKEGKKIKVRGTRCLKINNIHQHIRVVSMLYKVGLDHDVISLVYDEYKKRSDFPKPLKNLNINLPSFQEGCWKLSPRFWFQETVSLQEWIHLKHGMNGRVDEEEIKKREEKQNRYRIEKLFGIVESSKVSMTGPSEQLHWTREPRELIRVLVRPIPRGYKNSVMENVRFMGLLNGIDIPSKINYKIMDREMK